MNLEDESSSPDLTIVIPTYNAIDHLKDWELRNSPGKHSAVKFYFVDSFSSDGSEIYFDNLQRAYPNVTVYKAKSSIYEAMNVGIENCKTSLILFMGVDDDLLDDVEAALNEIKKVEDFNEIGIFITDYQIQTILPSGEIVIKNKQSDKQLQFPHHQSCFFNRAFLKSHLVYDTQYKILSDMDLIFTVLRLGKTKYIPIACVKFSKGGKSTNGDYFLKTFKELFKISKVHNRLFTSFFVISSTRIVYYFIGKVLKDLRLR